MREIICISVVLLGLAGRDQHTKSYIPTVAVATAAAEVQPLLSESTGLATCKSGKCGTRTQATIQAGTAKVRTRTATRRRLFRRTLKIRRR